jgi:RNA polymerase sigma factor (sigma-70 family)
MLEYSRRGQPTDQAEAIVHAAQAGDQRAAAILFELHYASMLAVATRMLGAGPDAEDACQDAAVTAFTRIGQLRDAAAVRGWLLSIVRNNCRTILGARTVLPAGLADQDWPATAADDPVAHIERSAQREWIWYSVRQLTPAVQPVAMLRYFTENNSYERIAALCGIPVGTVRSRLSEARRQLSSLLPQSLDAPHGETAALAAGRRAEAAGFLSAVPRGLRLGQVADWVADDVTMYWPGGSRTIGLAPIYAVMCEDYDDGVTVRLTSLTAGAGVTVWENEFINPPEDPDHCPPGGTWLLRERQGRVSEIRLLHTPRPAQAGSGRQGAKVL